MSNPQAHPATTRAQLHDTLATVFGYREFRSHQLDIIEHVLSGGSAFVLMPTGGGKSLCYQVPALHLEGTTIVVSPLISLMKDQVDALRANGVAAAYLNSSLCAEDAVRVRSDLLGGRLKLLYVAPERLMMPEFLSALRQARIAMFAIDEAHCVSQWGHDFRPEYVRLGELAELFPGVPTLALTATADEQTHADILLRLGLEGSPVFVAGFDRPNIRYTVAEKHNAPAQLERFISSYPGDSGIVYCLSRKRVEEVAARLRKKGVSAGAYHAGLSAPERDRVQEAFLRDEIQVVVATVAFGMGIDKPDVRFVVHHDMPKNIEGYYQETGRAGRDGLPAQALCLFGMQDVVTARMLIEGSGNAEQVRIELAKLNAMTGFAEATSCRRRVLLGYFGEPLEEDCGNCDVCLDPPEVYDGSVDAQKALSAVFRTGQRFGAGHIVDVLRGTATEKVAQWEHDQLSVFGVGLESSRDEWMAVLRQLVHLGYLKQDIAAYNALKLAGAAREVLRGELVVTLARPRPKVARGRAGEGGGRKRKAGSVALEGLEVDEELFERLRELRREIAAEQKVPAYVVFPDRTLAEMAARRPATEEELLECNGVGAAKLERYGAAFLAAISRGEENEPAA